MQITLDIPRDASWGAADRLRVFVGTEGAADLAGSTPPGGTAVMDVLVGALAGDYAAWGDGAWGNGAWGVAMAPDLMAVVQHQPAAVQGSLPVGVAAADLAGNVSAVDEIVVTWNLPPAGPRNLAVSATGNVGEAKLMWDLSVDVG